MLYRSGLLVLLVSLLGLSTAFAENAVVVESKTACTGAKGVTIGVSLTNDVSARHVTIPLEIRSEEGGAFITSLKLNWGGRMPIGRGNPLGDNVFTHQYREKDGTCTRTQKPGYATIAFSDTLAHPVKTNSVGALFSRFRFSGPELPAGKDEGKPSIMMTVDIGSKPGTFVIDTTCICPSHSLMFVYGSEPIEDVIPSFKKGVITVKACSKQ